MKKSDIGMIGLAVMGQSLALNMESRGFTVCVYDREPERSVKGFVEGRACGKHIIGAYSVREFVQSLEMPHKVMMMVRAGDPVDQVIDQLLPHLDAGDIIIDGGNSHHPDTVRRTKFLESRGILFVGAGVSGGEEGALKGPSIMPGGSIKAWPQVRPILQSIAAKAPDGTPCCDWVGDDGAGHFVKMVHNGIEYGDMQLICEAYHLMKELLGMSSDEMADVFKDWNRGELNSYLIEITGNILAFKDTDGTPLVEHVLDAAGQKGTGQWTSMEALTEHVALTLIAESVFARYVSAMKEERVAASKAILSPNKQPFEGDKQAMVDDIKRALYASKIVSYAQGFALMRSAAHSHGWSLDYGNIALLWRGGCIIRSVFLQKIKDAFDKNPSLANLMMDDFFKKTLEGAQDSWRRVCAAAVTHGVPMPAFVSALSYFDGYRCAQLPANLLQCQRDYFGAHTYERTDKPRGEFFHTRWIEA